MNRRTTKPSAARSASRVRSRSNWARSSPCVVQPSHSRTIGLSTMRKSTSWPAMTGGTRPAAGRAPAAAGASPARGCCRPACRRAPSRRARRAARARPAARGRAVDRASSAAGDASPVGPHGLRRRDRRGVERAEVAQRAQDVRDRHVLRRPGVRSRGHAAGGRRRPATSPRGSARADDVDRFVGGPGMPHRSAAERCEAIAPTGGEHRGVDRLGRVRAEPASGPHPVQTVELATLDGAVPRSLGRWRWSRLVGLGGRCASRANSSSALRSMPSWVLGRRNGSRPELGGMPAGVGRIRPDRSHPEGRMARPAQMAGGGDGGSWSVMSDRTLVLLKPDAVERGLVGNILGRFEAKGLRIVALDQRTLDKETLARHYTEHLGKGFYEDLVTSRKWRSAVWRSNRPDAQQRLDRAALVHRRVASGDVVEAVSKSKTRPGRCALRARRRAALACRRARGRRRPARRCSGRTSRRPAARRRAGTPT